MATPTQLENFEAAIAAIDPTLRLEARVTPLIVICRTMPTERIARYALNDMFTKLAHVYGLHFEGYTIIGQPYFTDLED